MKRLLFLKTCVVCGIILTSVAWASSGKIVLKRVKPKGHELLVDGNPFLIKGVIYHPIPPGKDHSYDFWTDEALIEKDAQFIKDAGFNTVRFYKPGDSLQQTKKIIELLYEKYGIYTVMGHWLGFWNYPAPFYADKSFQKNVKEDVLEMVDVLKDAKGLLMWVLGNENNYSFSGKVNAWTSKDLDAMKDPQEKMNTKAKIYYSFVNEVARQIKKIDRKHPVALGNGELITLDIAARYARDVDLLALIFYRGKGFGNIFNTVENVFNKPVLISEMGCDAYDAYKKTESQDLQSKFLLSQWLDVYKNTAFYEGKKNNCLGAIIFEWNDEWWKKDSWDSSRWLYHDTLGSWSNGSYYFDIKAPRNLNMNEEWFGIFSFQKDSENMFLKKPRKAYFVLKEFFQDPEKFLKGGK